MPPNPSIAYLEDLSPTALSELTALLRKPPQESPGAEPWLKRQATVTETLPRALRRESGFLTNVVMAMPFAPRGAELCKTHEPLNPFLIRRIFIQVSAEVTTRAERVTESDELPPDVEAFTKRLRSINSLWMEPGSYRAAFRVMPSEERHGCVDGGCEACILATIGGNFQILADLRTALVGRIKKRGPKPRLLRFVNAWVDWTPCKDEINKDSDDLGREVRAVRRELQEARRQRREDAKNGTAKKEITSSKATRRHSAVPDIDNLDGAEGDAKTERDFEDSIIDYYADLVSRAELAGGEKSTEVMHPAFRSSIAIPNSNPNPNSTPPRPPPPPPRAVNKYEFSESVYSRDEDGMSYAPNRGARSRTSQERARAYQSLVGEGDLYNARRNDESFTRRRFDFIDEDKEESLRPRQGRNVDKYGGGYPTRSPESRASSGMTEWGDFF